MKILSIQSAVAYGHVGNSAAVFPLQRIGVEVLPVYTVNFSNHTGYGAWRGPLISPADVAEVLTGIEERGVFPQIDAVLSSDVDLFAFFDELPSEASPGHLRTSRSKRAGFQPTGNPASPCRATRRGQQAANDWR